MWHGDSLGARLILFGLACALSLPGTTWTTPVLPFEAFMAPQVLEQMALRAALSAAISCRTQGKDSSFYDGPFPDGASTPQHFTGFLGEFDETISVMHSERGSPPEVSIFFPKDGTFL